MSGFKDTLRRIFHRSAKKDDESALSGDKQKELLNSTSHSSFTDTMRAAWKMIKPYWSSEEKWKARALLAGVVGLTLAQVGINVLLNNWNVAFYDSIQNYKEPEFYRQIGNFSAYATAWIGSVVYGNYLTQKLQMNWRQWMTKQNISSWFNKKAFYDIQQNGGPKADNPDQRISDDVNTFTDRTLNMSMGLLNAGVSLASFLGVLYNMSASYTLHMGQHSLTIPHYLVPLALGYSILGTVATQKIGKILPALNYNQQRKEADFRFGAVRIRENAESIALYGGEAVEKENMTQRFNRVVSNYWDIIKKQKQLTWFNSAFGQAAIIFPYVAVAHQYFTKQIKMGQMMQAASAFNYVQGSLSWFVNSFNQYADWKAATDRLSGFNEAIKESNERYDARVKAGAEADAGYEDDAEIIDAEAVEQDDHHDDDPPRLPPPPDNKLPPSGAAPGM